MFSWLRRRIEDLFGRSDSWARVRREHLEREPACAACGRSRELEVHHVVPYHERPELELDDGTNGLDGNLITLCADPCHFVHGHLLNWKRSNPHVREDADRYRERIRATE
jgi:5-methylcytosine-specific restriction endonuclease McrA